MAVNRFEKTPSYYATLKSDQEREAYRKKLHANETHELAYGAADGAVLFTIFSTFLTKASEAFLHATGRFILFTMAALVNVAISAILIREAHITGKRISKLKALMQTLFTIPIVIAVAGSLLLNPLSYFATVAAPLIFAVTLGIKFVYQAQLAAFYYGKSRNADSKKSEDYVGAAKANAVFAASTLMAVTAILTVFFAGITAFAPIGIAAGGIGLSYAGYLLYTKAPLNLSDIHYDSEEDDELDSDVEQENDLNRDLRKGFGKDRRHNNDGDYVASDDLTATNRASTGVINNAFSSVSSSATATPQQQKRKVGFGGQNQEDPDSENVSTKTAAKNGSQFSPPKSSRHSGSSPAHFKSAEVNNGKALTQETPQTSPSLTARK